MKCTILCVNLFIPIVVTATSITTSVRHKRPDNLDIGPSSNLISSAGASHRKSSNGHYSQFVSRPVKNISLEKGKVIYNINTFVKYPSQVDTPIPAGRIALMVLTTLSPLMRMTGFQEEGSLIVLAPAVGGRQVRRTLGCRAIHITPMSGQSASRLGKLNSTDSLINQQRRNLLALILLFPNSGTRPAARLTPWRCWGQMCGSLRAGGCPRSPATSRIRRSQPLPGGGLGGQLAVRPRT